MNQQHSEKNEYVSEDEMESEHKQQSLGEDEIDEYYTELEREVDDIA